MWDGKGFDERNKKTWWSHAMVEKRGRENGNSFPLVRTIYPGPWKIDDRYQSPAIHDEGNGRRRRTEYRRIPGDLFLYPFIHPRTTTGEGQTGRHGTVQGRIPGSGRDGWKEKEASIAEHCA